jgi:hypothetical protein
MWWIALWGCAPASRDDTGTSVDTDTTAIPCGRDLAGGGDATAPTALRSVPRVICTVAGVPGVAGLSEQTLFLPVDVAIHPETGELWIADLQNHRVVSVRPEGALIDVLGDGTPGFGVAGDVEGPAEDFAIGQPTALAFDPSAPDRVAVASRSGDGVAILDRATGLATAWTVGSGGWTDPAGVAWDDAGGLLVSVQGRAFVDHLPATGPATRAAGQPDAPGYAGDGGPAIEAQLSGLGVMAEPGNQLSWFDGAWWLADTWNQVVRRIDADGQIDTVAGVFLPAPAGGGLVGTGGDGGPATEARLGLPTDVAVGPDGSVFVADSFNHCIRRIAPDGTIDTYAGRCGTAGAVEEMGDGGPATDARFDTPTGVAVDRYGTVYVTDSHHHAVRAIRPD